MLNSTRSNYQITPSNAVVKGISNDGGLFILNDFSGFSFDESLLSLSYQDLAKKVLKFVFSDFNEKDIDRIVDNAYSNKNFDVPVAVKTFDKDCYLELWHGPTCAFKDMALTVLGGLLEQAKKNVGDTNKTVVLTATSGDTGSATLSGFLGCDIDVYVLYPNGGVSPVQEAQMQRFAVDGSKAISVSENFDFCQTLVKKVFTDKEFKPSVELSSANSINIGRLVPQIVYYMFTYLTLVREGKINFGEKIVFSVPTGNFGNILAGFIAKKLGVPVEKFICASNANDVLTDFFKTGVYDRKRPFFKTISPSMDILVSSNLERLLYILSGNDYEYCNELMNSLSENGKYEVNDKIKEGFKDFYPFALDDNGTAKEIKRVFEKDGYLIDPHTAVASSALESYRKATNFNGYGVVVSTASPYKFPIPVAEALGLSCENDVFKTIEKVEKFTSSVAPKAIKSLDGFKFEREVWSGDNAEENLKNLIGE